LSHSVLVRPVNSCGAWGDEVPVSFHQNGVWLRVSVTLGMMMLLFRVTNLGKNM
jgi:hypothetical protein